MDSAAAISALMKTREQKELRKQSKWLDTTADFTRSYKGKIDRYEIEMYLCKSSEYFYGFYKYKTQIEYLSLKGKKDSTGKVLLFEVTPDGRETGVFAGKINAQGFTGEWTVTDDGGPRYNFNLIELSLDNRDLIETNYSEVEVREVKNQYGITFPLIIYQARATIENIINKSIDKQDSCNYLQEYFQYKWYLQLVYRNDCHPHSYYDHALYDLRTGHRLIQYGEYGPRPLDIFKAEKRRDLLREIIPRIQKLYDEGKEYDCYHGDESRPVEITWNDISIRLSKEGIVFHYDFGYPESCAYMPEGDAFFKWEELQKYLAP